MFPAHAADPSGWMAGLPDQTGGEATRDVAPALGGGSLQTQMHDHSMCMAYVEYLINSCCCVRVLDTVVKTCVVPMAPETHPF